MLQYLQGDLSQLAVVPPISYRKKSIMQQRFSLIIVIVTAAIVFMTDIMSQWLVANGR